MNWKKYITDQRTGRPHRGSISRIAELLGTHYGNVHRMFLGIWNPSADEASALRAIVQSRTVLAPKKRSDAGQPRGKYRKRAAENAMVPQQSRARNKTEDTQA